MSDRIAVMHRGTIGVLDRTDATQSTILALALAQLRPTEMRGLGRREASVAGAVIALGLVLAAVTPGFFARDNLSDLFANMPVLIIALGMTLVILTGHIDISVGSLFAVCAVAPVLAKAGLPMPLVVAAACHGRGARS